MTSPDLFKFLEQTWRPWMVRLICCGRDDGEYQAMTWEEADQFRESYTSGAGVASHWSRPWEGHVRSAIITEWPPGGGAPGRLRAGVRLVGTVHRPRHDERLRENR